MIPITIQTIFDVVGPQVTGGGGIGPNVTGGGTVGIKEIPLGTLKGLGPLGDFLLGREAPITLFNKVISNIIAILTISAGLWFILQFILGAWSWLSAGSDKASLENAQKKLTNSVIGLAIVVAAIFLIDLIGRLLGLDILRPGKFILEIWK